MIRVADLCARAGGFHLREVSFDLPRGSYGAMVGPTGAGKTLLLESVAGLLPVERGSIEVHGSDVTSEAPEERRVGYVPQEPTLFPHMDVSANIAFGLEVRAGSAIEGRVSEVARLLGILDLLDRRPRTLSGGEAQRAALARALAPRPGVLLLDEPLTGLDGRTRAGMVEALRQVHRTTQATVLHVTHDLDEAASLATHLGVIRDGTLLQWGTWDEVFRHPATVDVARSVGVENLLAVSASQRGTAGAELTIGSLRLATAATCSGPVTAAIRGQDVSLLAPGQPDAPSTADAASPLVARVTALRMRSRDMQVLLDPGEGAPPLEVCTTAAVVRALGLREGSEVGWSVRPGDVHVIAGG